MFRMQSNFVLCLGSSAFLIVDSTFNGQCHVEAGKGRGQYCFSKPCLLFRFEHRSLQQRQLPRKYIQLWDSPYQMPSSKLVLNGDCGVQKGEAVKL